MAIDSDPSDRIDREARDWVLRLGSGQATKRDAGLVRQWRGRSARHEAAFARARQEWHDAGQVAETYRRMYPQPGRRIVADPRRRMLLGAGLSAAGAAAVVAVVRPPLGLWPSWSELAADYRTGTGEQLRVALAAQVELTLNTQTSLAIENMDGASRSVRLIAGEAAVQRGPGAQRVLLLAGRGRIVPGVGSVEVRRADDGRHCVTCTDGEARLEHPARSLLLHAGDQIRYGADDVGNAASVDMDQALAWRQGVVAFHNTPLASAIAEINRYRRGRVMLMNEALAQRRLSGHFRIDALDEAILQIEQVFGAEVIRLPSGVVVLA